MKTLMITFALVLTACGAEDEKHTVLEEEGHTVLTENAPADECLELSREDEVLEEHFQDFLLKYEESGSDDLPIEVLERLIVLKKIPWNQLKTEEKQRNGFLERVTCKNQLKAFRIYVADPDTVPDDKSLSNPLLFKETVFHEIAHAFYGHYDGDEKTVTSKHGLMAARKDIKDTTLEAHEVRIAKFFGDESYKAHLPKHFHVQPEGESVDQRTVDQNQ